MRIYPGSRVIACLAWAALMMPSLAAADRYLVHTESSDDFARVATRYNLTVVGTVPSQNLYVVAPPTGAQANLSQQLGMAPGVASVEDDQEVTLPPNPAPPPLALPSSLLNYLSNTAPTTFYGSLVRSGYIEQPATWIIDLDPAHAQFPVNGSVVAVIDTGVDPTHPAFANSLVPGYDFVHNVAGIPSELADLSQSTVAILDQSTVAILDSKNDPLVLNQSTVAILDQSTVAILDGQQLPGSFGHGTMVSGLVHLVAPDAMIMPLKAFTADGTARLSDVIRAIYYAADNGAMVINMSFSFSDPSPDLQQAIAYAIAKGVTPVAAVGNSGRETMVYPAGFQGVIGVASTNNSDTRSLFSNYGDVARVSAPGESLITLYPGNNYAMVSGTSFSAPLVSGTVALMKWLVPGMTPQYAMGALRKGRRVAESIGSARLDVLNSLLYCSQYQQSQTEGSDDSEDDGGDD